ncbi:MAG: 3-dehydroquinate synthase [Bacteroidales bacterium]|jgi:3-dehydroquinate synthase|nr:3-dehydroquinate synthase [Bacteroidales bacterium]
MRRIKVNTATGRSVLIIGGKLNDLPSLLPPCRLFIITDNNVRALYGDSFPPAEVLTVQPGEESKSLMVAGELCSRLLAAGADRSSFILGFGGGVVCDIAGFVASVYMRGLRHAFVSTTLLSQVDASIGGKTGVNMGRFKNMIGTFKQPEFVLCDHTLLSTLPDTELLSGLGELIKHAAIGDRELFFDISASLSRLFEHDQVSLENLIYRAVKIKAAIVRRDPLEDGIRRVLNFGHTFGHVLETAYQIPHGIAVMEGMMIAAELSVWKGELPYTEARILKSTLESAGVMKVHDLPENILGLIIKDKKSESEYVNMVLLQSIGKAVVRKLHIDELKAFTEYFIQMEG